MSEIGEKFWTLAAISEIKSNVSDTDKRCEEHFQNTQIFSVWTWALCSYIVKSIKFWELYIILRVK